MGIRIDTESETSDGWQFEVAVAEEGAERRYRVELSRAYWRGLSGEGVSPRELMEASFRFLLSREPKEAILERFSLSDIPSYFPEYEEEMRSRLGR